MDEPLVGSEAIGKGLVRKHELRSRYTAVFPDVYVPNGTALDRFAYDTNARTTSPHWGG